MYELDENNDDFELKCQQFSSISFQRININRPQAFQKLTNNADSCSIIFGKISGQTNFISEVRALILHFPLSK